jgi:hypothetical protein
MLLQHFRLRLAGKIKPFSYASKIQEFRTTRNRSQKRGFLRRYAETEKAGGKVA